MTTTTSSARCRMRVQGTVQGVGFRPFVYRTATALQLRGSVGNTEQGVVVDVEGTRERIRDFIRRLRSEAPPLARVQFIEEEWLAPADVNGFVILPSAADGAATTTVPPDVAVCSACLRELLELKDRRAGYPFINCTDCGPRFTIIESVPYDRARTTMRDFALCPECRAEYEDPASRRFHAEPNACPRCGPRIWLAGADGKKVDHQWPLLEVARLLRQGRLLALKGVGGFHLAADAGNAAAVDRLRALKQRDRKPLAVMVADVDAVNRVALASVDELDLLSSPARPIVLLRKGERYALAAGVAPGVGNVGVMLPYSPLHHLLLRACTVLWPEDVPPVLVMTSANPGGEPIVRDNDEARERLAGTADAFLFHDRRILVRTDDSVAMHAAGRPRLLRRSRGYTPLPVALPVEGPPVLAVGGDLKNAFCITRGKEAFLGPHVGDLENAATAAYFHESVQHLCTLLDVVPQAIAHDLHPDYVSTRLARALGSRWPLARLLEVQHHHAHVLSCLAENGVTGITLGLALDGAGHGTDGTSWGGELLLVDGARFQRLGHLSTLPMPGGDQAAREPWRMALAALVEAGAHDLAQALAQRWSVRHGEKVMAVLRMAQRGAPFPRSSSLGRLFDTVSALAGVCEVSSYEGEAAMALEYAAGTLPGHERLYPVSTVGSAGGVIMDTSTLLRSVAAEALAGTPAATVAARLHATLVDVLASAVEEVGASLRCTTVALTGGAFQNRILLDKISARLAASRFRVLTHALVPANDGGLALGQAVSAVLTLRGSSRT